MDIEPPSMEDIKKNMYVPAAEDAEGAGEGDVAKLMKEVKVLGGASGKKERGTEMTEADQACYASRYSDLEGKPAKEHYKLVGAE
jgi:hypothetical protein